MIHVAPLAKISTRQWQKLMRLLSKDAVIWSEMVHARAILNADLEYIASRYFRPEEDRVGRYVLQVASGHETELVDVVKTLSRSRFWDFFDEINLNCGCPAPSAGAGGHGAVLLKDQSRLKVRKQFYWFVVCCMFFLLSQFRISSMRWSKLWMVVRMCQRK